MKKLVKSARKWIKELDVKTLLLCFGAVYLAAFIGSIFSWSGVRSVWYFSIMDKVIVPSWVFPLAWNILFFMIFLSLYLAWKKSKKEDKRTIAIVFAVNLFLNVLWSLIFFVFFSSAFAFYEIIALAISIGVMIFFLFRIRKLSAFLLVPYLLWVLFAGYLNFSIVYL